MRDLKGYTLPLLEADPFPWARFPDGHSGPRSALTNGHLYWRPRTVLLTHPHDGHGEDDICIDCLRQARSDVQS